MMQPFPASDASRKNTVLDPELLQAIGLLIVTAATGEAHLSGLVLRRLEHSNLSRMYPVVAGMEASLKINLIKILSKQISPWAHNPIVKACERVKKSYEKRNIFAHSSIERELRDGKLVIQGTRQAKDGTLPQAQCYSASEITKFARELARSLTFLDNLLVRCGVPLLDK